MPRPSNLDQVTWTCERRHSHYVIRASWADAEGKEWTIGDSISFPQVKYANDLHAFICNIILRMTLSLLTRGQAKRYRRQYP